METVAQERQLIELVGESSQEIESVCIVIPTYNEATNIERVLDRIFGAPIRRLEPAGVRLSVLVVDDNSPDGTARKVQSYRKKNPDVYLLMRKNKEGLGRAYIAGMQYALDILDPDAIIEMDADLSHDPTDIPTLVQELIDGADFAIGSRYVPGGEIPEEWGVHRKLTSACANLATRLLLGIEDVKDCSGGFRAMRTSILKKIDLGSLSVRGYAFQAVLLEEFLHRNGKVVEVPIRFSDRTDGSSKMRINDMLEGFSAFARVRTRRILDDLRSAGKT